MAAVRWWSAAPRVRLGMSRAQTIACLISQDFCQRLISFVRMGACFSVVRPLRGTLTSVTPVHPLSLQQDRQSNARDMLRKFSDVVGVWRAAVSMAYRWGTGASHVAV